jgi:hypothetical protein
MILLLFLGGFKLKQLKAHQYQLCLYLLGLILIFFPPPVFASSTAGSVSQVSGFIKSIIQIMAGLAGMVATAYFVVGGFNYITSSGNPQRLEKAKRTILYSAIGLSITIAAFVISGIISSLASKSFGG